MPITLPPDPPAGPVEADLGPPTTAGERLYARLGPVATYDDDNGNVVQALAETLAEPQQIIEDVTRDGETREAWAIAGDPDTAPAELLPWLAQLAGVRLLDSDTEAQQRLRIKTAAGYYRGTPRAIIEELQLLLTGTKQVFLLTRDPDMWHQTVGTLTSESAAATVAQLDNAVKAQKPAGVLVDRVTVAAWSLLEITATVAAHRETIDGVDTYVADLVYETIGDLEAAFATIALLEAGP